MRRFVEGTDRGQSALFPECLEDWIGEDNPVRVVDVFVEEQNAMYQIKTGFEDLTTVQHGGQLPNLEAIRRDRALIEQRYEVTWVLEK